MSDTLHGVIWVACALTVCGAAVLRLEWLGKHRTDREDDLAYAFPVLIVIIFSPVAFVSWLIIRGAGAAFHSAKEVRCD